MRALVTGANGFVGSFLTEHLTVSGDDVRALVRAGSDAKWLFGTKATIVNGTLEDRDSLVAAMEGVEVVFHVAGLTKSARPEPFFAVNERATANVLDAAARVKAPGGEPPIVVVVSSLAAAGPSEFAEAPRDEEAVPAPVSAYGRSKLAGERAARARAGRVPVTIVRPPVVYGPRDRDALEIFKVAKRGIVPAPGFGAPYFSWIFVRDLVAALRAIAMTGERVGSPRPGDGRDSGRGVYFVSDGTPHTWQEIALRAGAALGRENVLVPPAPLALTWILGALGEAKGRWSGTPSIINLDKAREASARHWVCDATKAFRYVGFTPEYGLERGFEETVHFYRGSGWL